MTDRRVSRRSRRHLESGRYTTPLPTLTLTPLAEMVARIEAARLDVPPRCAACEAVKPTTTRRCSRCQRTLLLVGNFTRDRAKPLGYRYTCRECAKADNKRSNVRRQRRQFRSILGRAS